MGMIHRGILCALLAGVVALSGAAAARAQCTGDCGADGKVTINELIIGVSIALSRRPAADCPAFQNELGMVNIAQLIRAVGFALRGCPPDVSPTATSTGAATDTATPTSTSLPPTATLSPTVTPTLLPIGTQHCTLIPGNSASHIDVNRASFPVPSILPLRGSIDIACTAAGCSCQVGTFEPVSVNGVGKICVVPSDVPCAPRPLTCGGGGAGLGVIVVGDGNVDHCTGNAECATQCAATCAATGSAPVASGCTGFCSSGTMQTCNRDDQCAPANGVCNGRDAVGANAGQCQCQCVNGASGAAARAGELQCGLSGQLVVVPENADCTAAPRFASPSCMLLTTSVSSSVLTDTNYTSGASIPASGLEANTGAPVSCDMLRQGHLTGLKLRGAFGAFGGTLSGDALNEVFIDCQ